MAAIPGVVRNVMIKILISPHAARKSYLFLGHRQIDLTYVLKCFILSVSTVMLSLKERFSFCTWEGSRHKFRLSLVIFQISTNVKMRNLLIAHTSYILLDKTMAVARSEKWRSTATNQVPQAAD